jgi:hypothetical protein
MFQNQYYISDVIPTPPKFIIENEQHAQVMCEDPVYKVLPTYYTLG